MINITAPADVRWNARNVAARPAPGPLTIHDRGQPRCVAVLGEGVELHPGGAHREDQAQQVIGRGQQD